MNLTLPYPPSANAYWRTWKGRILVSAEARKYKQGVRLRALTAGVRPMSGPVMVALGVYRPRKTGDLDNTLKVLLDSLCGVAFEDDAQVVELHAIRFDDRANPRVSVSVEAA
jgi:Holliday junction resolvase RusA-like endonuclease